MPNESINTKCNNIFYGDDPFCKSTEQQSPCVLEHWILIKPLYLIKGKKPLSFILLKNLNLYIIFLLIGES